MIILVAGGTGFLGKRVVAQLEREGHTAIVYHRGFRGVPTSADVIVNCIGILTDRTQSFEEAHVETAKWLLALGKKLKIKQFVQVSAIGARLDGTPYQRSKAQAEKLVIASGLPYAIIRPSIMFGTNDKSINTFRAVARTGFFPLFANGKVQPVSVNTVAALVVAAVQRRIRDRVVEVGGPEVFTYDALLDRVHPGVRTFALPQLIVHFFTMLSSIIPALPTDDMVEMLKQDNVTNDKTVDRLKIKNPRVA